MNQRKLYLAAYDVSHAKRLRRALEVLRDFSTGGQKSVFECFLSQSEHDELLQRIAQVIDAEEDRFFLLRLDPRSKVQTLGLAERPADPSYYYFG